MLGAALCGEGTLGKIAQVVQPEHFARPLYRRIYEAMLAMQKRGVPIDPILLSLELGDKSLLAQIAGLMEGIPKSVAVDHFTRLVLEESYRRQCYGILTDAWGRIRDGGDALTVAEAVREQIREASHSCRRERLWEDLPALLDGLSAHFSPKASHRLPMPFPAIHESIGELYGGMVIVLAARPQVGKSMLALNWASLLSKGLDEVCTAYFSLEMPNTLVAERFLKSRMGQTTWTLKREVLEGAPLVLGPILSTGNRFVSCDRPGLMLSECSRMLAEMREWVGIPIPWVIFDHLQLLRPEHGRYTNKYESATEVSRSLVEFAKREQVGVLALSQLSRSERKSWEPPELESLRDTGALEEDAHAVIGLWRPELDPEFKDACESDPGLEHLRNALRGVVLKGRNGGTGDRFLWRWDKLTCVMTEVQESP